MDNFELQTLKSKLNYFEDVVYSCIQILIEFEELNPALTRQQYAKINRNNTKH